LTFADRIIQQFPSNEFIYCPEYLWRLVPGFLHISMQSQRHSQVSIPKYDRFHLMEIATAPAALWGMLGVPLQTNDRRFHLQA
jgi:hypothetical protein